MQVWERRGAPLIFRRLSQEKSPPEAGFPVYIARTFAEAAGFISSHPESRILGT
jgi:hypothetical protein